MKKLTFFLLLIVSNFSFAKVEIDSLKVIYLLDYIINSQKTIFTYTENNKYTDSLLVKDFNFNNFKYNKIVKKLTNEYCKLYFVENEIKKIRFRKNKQTVDLYLFKYKGLLLAKSPFLGLDILYFDIVNEKIISFNFEIKGVIDEHSYSPIDHGDLKKILLLNQDLNPKSVNYFENLNFVAGSNFLYKRNKIFEEISIISQLPNNKRFYDLTLINFSKLYYYLENSIYIIGLKDFRRFLVEITIPDYSGFFWYQRFEQNFPKVKRSEFKNIY